MKISKLYGKKIQSADGKLSGVVMAISCNKNVIDGYICFDQDEKEFFAKAAGAKILKDKVIFSELGYEGKNSFRLRLGLPVFTQGGKHLGFVTECSVTGGKLNAVFIKNKKYSASQIRVLDAVIVKEPIDKTQAELAAKNMFIGALCGS